MIGCWGNYVNYEVYGRIDYSGVSLLIFGRVFVENMFLKDESGIGYRYLLFLYELIVNLFVYIILVWVIN